MASGDASPSTQITRPSGNCTRYSSCQSAVTAPTPVLVSCTRSRSSGMEHSEPAWHLQQHLRCNPFVYLPVSSRWHKGEVSCRPTKTVLVKAYRDGYQLFSLSAHSVQRLLDPSAESVMSLLPSRLPLGRPEASPLNVAAGVSSEPALHDDATPQIKGLSAHGSIPYPIEEGAVFR